MSLPTQTQVLIVGAGPAGMACALTLVGLGYKVTIVDASPTDKNGSRSVVIHARTLEVMKTLGLAQALMETGNPSRGAIIHGSTNKLLEVNLGLLRDETEFPVALLIPQHDVERILRDKLAEIGVEIRRPHRAVGMKEAPSGGLDVTFDDGSIVRSRYVVGADGSRSTIRSLAGIDFKDPKTGIDFDGNMPPSSTFEIALADVYLEEPLPVPVARDAISFHLNQFFFLCPLRCDAKDVSFWRMGIGISSTGPMPPQHPDLAYLQGELNNRFPWKAKPRIASVTQASRYRVRAAVASTLFKNFGEGCVLLVGDAAHVHSPAGGQGMNLGLCDAVSLGHAIHAHIDSNRGVATEEPIDLSLANYSDSRRKVALKVVGMTGGITAVVNAGRGWRMVVRNVALWIAGKSPFLRRAIAWRLSGLGHRDADVRDA